MIYVNKTDVLTKRLGSTYDKKFFNRLLVSSKILLKFFKINHRHHLEMNLYNLHESNHEKKEKFFNVLKLK